MLDRTFRILIIEDNPTDVLLFREALETAGVRFEMLVAADGAEALTSLSNWDGPLPNLIILDLLLPKIDGKNVLEAIDRNDRFSRVPVMITSSGNPV
jgi:CheY-like chemotaxis protein